MTRPKLDLPPNELLALRQWTISQALHHFQEQTIGTILEIANAIEANVLGGNATDDLGPAQSERQPDLVSDFFPDAVESVQ